MNYEWDENKRRRNIEIHGVDFLLIEKFEWDKAVFFQDRRKEYSETRLVSFAPIDGRLFCAVYTQRENAVRIISLRKANRREVKYYESESDHYTAD